MDRLPRLIAVVCLACLAVGITAAWFSDDAEGEGADPGSGAVGQVGESSKDAPPSTGSPGDADNGQALPEHLLRDLAAPSMCDGLSRTSDSGMASLLRARGLADQLPADVAAEVGSIRGFYCSTDVLAGKVAIIFVGEDESGFALLRVYAHDGRTSYAAAGELVGLSSGAARRRFHRLEDSGALAVRTIVDPGVDGLCGYTALGITVEGSSHEVARKIAAFGEVALVATVLGAHDIVAEAGYQDMGHLAEMLDALRSLDGVRTLQSFPYLTVIKDSMDVGL